MTDQRLRELLEERVADLEPVDLAEEAWLRSSTVRRRRRALAGVAVAVVVVIGGTTAVVTGRGGDAPPAPATKSVEGSAPAEPAGRYAGVPYWWAPSVEDEPDLPRLERTALPSVIDLGSPVGEVPSGFRAIALFQLWGDQPGDVIVLGPDGTPYTLDVSHLETYSERGNVLSPASEESLSPDGRYAFFRQRGELAVYDFATTSWATTRPRIDSYVERARWLPSGLIEIQTRTFDPDFQHYDPTTGEDVGGSMTWETYRAPRARDEVYGPLRRRFVDGARGMFLAGPVGGARSVDAVGAGSELGPTALLVMPPEPGGGRWKQCCSVVGWLDSDTLLFESRHADARILAWTVGTADVFQVSDVRGWTPGEESYVASFADLAP